MIEVAAIERYFILIKRASKAHSKDVRLDFTDAVVLASEISALLAMIAKSSTGQTKTIGDITMEMDGGSL